MTDQPNLTPLTPVDEPSEFLTWEELSTPLVKTRFVPEYNKSVKYLSFVPLDKVLEFQAKSRMGTAGKDLIGYFAQVIQYVMVEPACKTAESARAAMKGNAPLLLSIANEVAGVKDSDVSEAKAQLAKT